MIIATSYVKYTMDCIEDVIYNLYEKPFSSLFLYIFTWITIQIYIYIYISNKNICYIKYLIIDNWSFVIKIKTNVINLRLEFFFL